VRAVTNDATGGGGAVGKEPGLDPVARYLRFHLERLIGRGPGQMLQRDVAERVKLSESGLSQFKAGKTGLNESHYADFARLLRIRGKPAEAAERLVSDAVEWYRSLVGDTMPLLAEPDVRQAISLVAQSEEVSPQVVESVLAAYGNSRFLGRDTAFWVRTLIDEMRFDAANAAASVAPEKK
jgi:hypothetical protein